MSRFSTIDRLNGLLLCLALLLAPSLRAAEEKAEDPDEVLLREAGIKTDSENLLNFLRERSPERPTEEIARLVRALGSDVFRERLEARERLPRFGKIALEALRPAAKSRDPQVVEGAKEVLQTLEEQLGIATSHAAIRLLVKRRVAGAEEALLRYIPFAEEEDVEVEIYYGLDELVTRRGALPAVVRQALTDPETARRALAGCLTAWRGTDEDRAAVRKLLKDKEPLVRLRSAQGLLAARDGSGLETLIGLLNEPDVSISWSAEELLHWVAGETGPAETVGAASVKERQQCQSAWEKWHQQHGAKLDLVRHAKEASRPGLLWICHPPDPQEGPLGRGSFRLCGSDGKPRWVQNSQQYRKGDGYTLREHTSDVQLLQGNRLLLVEQNAVIERPLDGPGKKLWPEVTPFADSCRRLANGHLVVTTSYPDTVILELDPSGKEIFVAGDLVRDDRQNLHRIKSVWRLPSGRVAWISDKFVMGLSEARTHKVIRQNLLTPPPGKDFASGRILPNGNWLVDAWDRSDGNSVLRRKEYDNTGKAVTDNPYRSWEVPPKLVDDFLRNGNVLGRHEGVYSMSPSFHVIGEYDRTGRKVWEAFLPYAAYRVRVCLPLVRFGFDTPAERMIEVDTVERRVRQLRHKDPVIRHGAAMILARKGAKAEAAMPVLFEALVGVQGERLSEMAWAAIAVRGPDSVPLLLKYAKDRNPTVRYWALWGLFTYHDRPKEIVPVLLEAFRDDDPAIRAEAALRAYPFRSNIEVTRALIRALDDKDREPGQGSYTVGNRALDSLMGRGSDGEEVAAALMKVSRTPGHHLRQSACYKLGHVARLHKESGTAILSLLVSTLKETDDVNLRLAAASALSDMGPEAKLALPALRSAFQVRDIKDAGDVKRMKHGIVYALLKMGGDARDAVPELIAALQDTSLDPDTRRHAAQTLGKIGPNARDAIPVLRKVLADAGQPFGIINDAAKALAEIER